MNLIVILFILLGLIMVLLGARLSGDNIVRSSAKGKEVRNRESYIKANRILYIVIGILSIIVGTLFLFHIITYFVMIIIYLSLWVINKLALMTINGQYIIVKRK